MPTVDIEKPVTFTAFEGRVEGKTIKGVSLLQKGPALGHGVWVDQVMLEQCKKLATAKGKLKAKQNHWSGIEDTLGYYENFRIRAGKLVADLTMFESSPSSALMLEMIETIPESFGVSIMFAPDAEEYDKENDRYNARVRELYSADFVDTPAANRDGVFQAAIDKPGVDMADNKPTTETFASKDELSALKAEIEKLTTALSALQPKEPEKNDEPKAPDNTAALTSKLDELTGLVKALAAAPPTKPTEAAPPNDPESAPPPPKSYADARKEAIGDATGLERIKAARAFDAKHPNEAAYLASFKR